MKRILLALSLLTALLNARGEEFIPLFKSTVEIHENSEILITEEITVNIEHVNINHGVYRDFPTTYRHKGKVTRVRFDIKNVLLDGAPVDYHTESLSNGQRVYMGSSDNYAPKGVHTYTLQYLTNRQIYFGDTLDEFAWNVTGPGWEFVMDSVVAVVRLPDSAHALQWDGYTGTYGSTEKDFIASVSPDSTEVVFITKGLYPGSDFTIAVGWKKGIVQEPDFMDHLRYFVQDYPGAIALFIAITLVLIYYLIVWSRVGKDPKAGTIVPRWDPPRNLSPGAIRFIYKRKFDDTTFTAGVVDAAVEGAFRIDQKDKKTYELTRADGSKAIKHKAERKMYEKLFRSKSTVTIENKYQSNVKNARTTYERELYKEYDESYFVLNRSKFFIGAGLSLLGLIIAGILHGQMIIPAIVVIGFTIAGFYLFRMALGKFKHSVGSGIFTLLFSLPWIILPLLVFGFSGFVPWVLAIPILVLMFLNLLFFELLEAPTMQGREVLDEIEGLKMYLETAEEDRLNLSNPPDKTPQLFEALLPYAIALDCENKWGDKFQSVLEKANEEGYQPTWYRGHLLTTAAFYSIGSTMSSNFSGTISSAASPPSSSGGGYSGGGGFSGGGGGGGGGGGW